MRQQRRELPRARHGLNEPENPAEFFVIGHVQQILQQRHGIGPVQANLQQRRWLGAPHPFVVAQPGARLLHAHHASIQPACVRGQIRRGQHFIQRRIYPRLVMRKEASCGQPHCGLRPVTGQAFARALAFFPRACSHRKSGLVRLFVGHRNDMAHGARNGDPVIFIFIRWQQRKYQLQHEGRAMQLTADVNQPGAVAQGAQAIRRGHNLRQRLQPELFVGLLQVFARELSIRFAPRLPAAAQQRSQALQLDGVMAIHLRRRGQIGQRYRHGRAMHAAHRRQILEQRLGRLALRPGQILGRQAAARRASRRGGRGGGRGGRERGRLFFRRHGRQRSACGHGRFGIALGCLGAYELVLLLQRRRFIGKCLGLRLPICAHAAKAHRHRAAFGLNFPELAGFAFHQFKTPHVVSLAKKRRLCGFRARKPPRFAPERAPCQKKKIRAHD